MQPSPQRKTEQDLREWAMQILAREQESGTYGTVTVHLEAGRVVRVRTERSEMPAQG